MNIENRLALAYSDGIFIELIEVVSVKSIFMDYINHNSADGLQHITYNTPIAKIVFFDTQNEINGCSY